VSTPKIIPADTRASVGELAARAGEITARKLFEARGNRSEAHLSELELAMIAATAAHVALSQVQS
jgi:hypothetical protein